MTISKVNIDKKFELIEKFWQPHIVGELNDQHVKIAKLKGDFVWHKHENEDEMFLVLKGVLFIDLKDKTLKLEKGEFVIIPRGIKHKPFALDEVEILLFEPKSTLNTGNIINDKTVKSLKSI